MKGMGIMGVARVYRSGTLLGTERRKRIVAFVACYYEANRRPPTIKEIGKDIGVTSTSLVSYYLDRLETDGIISRTHNSARSVMLTQVSA